MYMLGVDIGHHSQKEKGISGQYVEPKGEIKNGERTRKSWRGVRTRQCNHAIKEAIKQASKRRLVLSCRLLFRSTVGHPCSAINMSELFILHSQSSSCTLTCNGYVCVGTCVLASDRKRDSLAWISILVPGYPS